LRIVGADAHLGEAYGEDVLDGGVALVLGNEARGLSDDVRAHVDAWARLPIVGRAESLNVAVAGGVLMYEWLRRRMRS
jgi:TrmH family RNA methyltransferase